MTLDPAARRFLDRLAASQPPSARTLSVAERRDALASLLAFGGTRPAVAAVEERVVHGPGGELPVRLYTPAGTEMQGPRMPVGAETVAPALPASGLPAPRLPALVYFHGGGLVAGSLDTHDGICRHLANASGCRVISVGYRLAPEHPFPAAIEDGIAAVQAIAARAGHFSVDPDRIGVGGDSAGATLAAVVCQQLAAGAAEAVGPVVRVAMQFLLCPILDFRAETASRRELASGYFLDQATLEHDLAHYLPGGVDAADPRVSPLRAREDVLRQLPPACIHSAEYDPLRDEAASYARRLPDAGVATVHRCHAGMIHLFYGLDALIPRAQTAFELMGRDMRALLGAGERVDVGDGGEGR